MGAMCSLPMKRIRYHQLGSEQANKFAGSGGWSNGKICAPHMRRDMALGLRLQDGEDQHGCTCHRSHSQATSFDMRPLPASSNIETRACHALISTSAAVGWPSGPT